MGKFLSLQKKSLSEILKDTLFINLLHKGSNKGKHRRNKKFIISLL